MDEMSLLGFVVVQRSLVVVAAKVLLPSNALVPVPTKVEGAKRSHSLSTLKFSSDLCILMGDKMRHTMFLTLNFQD